MDEPFPEIGVAILVCTGKASIPPAFPISITSGAKGTRAGHTSL
ncbi:MAG: hypothetical protein ACRD3Q_17505 [Terriglobales bacterium]